MSDWHESHEPRFSMSSWYDEVCDKCGVTDRAPRHKRAAPCGLPDEDGLSPFIKAMYEIAGKKTIFMLAYGGSKHGNKWLEFIELISKITYKPGWYFRVGIEDERMWFQVGVTEEAEISYDPIAGKKVPWRGAKHYLSPHMCRNEVVTGVKHAIDRAEMHEVNEWFRYKGRSIYNPHIDPDALVEVAAKKENFNTRENAMTMEEPN